MFLWVSSGDQGGYSAQKVIELRFMCFVFQPPLICCLFKFYSSDTDRSCWVTLTELFIALLYIVFAFILKRSGKALMEALSRCAFGISRTPRV